MEQHVDIGREIVVEHRGFDEFDVVSDILRRTEIGIVDSDDIVILGKVVSEVRSDESCATGDKNALVVHK
jgi:hypothetical protein